METTLRLNASDVIRAARHLHPEVWARWQASGEPVLMPVEAPVSRRGAPAGKTPATVALHGPRAAAELPGGSTALVIAPTDSRRLQWLCPRLGHSCRALYLPDGATRFLSRQGHGLRYRSLSERLAERAARRARKLRATLGEHRAALGGPLPDRPLGMHAATYARLCADIREAEGRALVTSPRLLACPVAESE